MQARWHQCPCDLQAHDHRQWSKGQLRVAVATQPAMSQPCQKKSFLGWYGGQGRVQEARGIPLHWPGLPACRNGQRALLLRGLAKSICSVGCTHVQMRSSETQTPNTACHQESFRSALDVCAELLDPLLEKPLLDVLFKAPGTGVSSTFGSECGSGCRVCRGREPRSAQPDQVRTQS